jgi:N6-L-threonylcarbamoyladenine synthase
VTNGPGLIGSLLVGLSFAKAMAFALGKPLVPVNHIEGHIYSPFIENPSIPYPVLALVVSGGHTSLISVPEPGKYVSIGRARDDAAGEALDKLAKFLGLGYPGGPIIDRIAAGGNPKAFRFSIPKISDGTLDFSFSGFKTAALKLIQEQGIRPHKSGREIPGPIRDLVASYQQAIVRTLTAHTVKATDRLHPRSILLVGGVACNSLLRATFAETFGRDRVFYPAPSLTTDNAAMIAAAGTPKLQNASGFPSDLNAFADLRLC